MATICWDVSPEWIRFGGLAIRWYGVCFALAFAAGYLLVRWQFQIEGKDPQALDRLLGYVMAGTFIGARLGHCLCYDPAFFLSHPLEIPAIWHGGLASHGGAAGVLLALYCYTRRHPDQPYLWLLDRMALPAALAGSLIRVGNLFNSEILGRPAEVPWAFHFVRIDAIPRHPAQLYEAIAYALVFLVLLLAYRRIKDRPGLLLGLFLATAFSFRFLIEFLKEPQSPFESALLLDMGQWLSIPFIITGLALVWRRVRQA